MEDLSAAYWSRRYMQNNVGWDLQVCSTPIKAYIDQLKNKDIRILIPGCGNAHEAEYLFEKGFSNIFVSDLAQEPLLNLQKRVPDFPKSNILHQDFFSLTETYDLIVEQTLFCAIDPVLRQKYAEKMYELLIPGGKLVGVLFNRTFDGGPPFGGSREEYHTYFDWLFSEVYMEDCYNSVSPRAGSELFITMVK